MSKKPRPYKSGICAFSTEHYKCKGEFKNGSLAGVTYVKCSCECHRKQDK